MKKLSLLLTLVLLCTMLPIGSLTASAEEEEINILCSIWSPYSQEVNFIQQISEATGVKINMEYALSSDFNVRLNSVLADRKLPDMIIGGSVATLRDQGAIIPLTDYITPERMPNMAARLTESDLTYLRNAIDGEIYTFPYKHDMPQAMSFIIRTDWLERLNLEKPQTWEEWLTVWRAFRDQDANGNGDPSDEIPFTGNAYALMPAFGIPVSTQGQGSYVTVMPDGSYNLIWEHPNFRVYLENMAMLYAEGILDQEFASRKLTNSYSVMNSGIGGSMQAFAEQSQVTTKALRETDPNAKCECIEPVQGPLGDKMIPARSTISAKGAVTIEGKKKIDTICKVIDWIWSDEGMTLLNYGIEGTHFTMVDGKPVIQAPYNESFTTARSNGIAFQMIPFCWTQDSYMQILTQGKTYEELPEEGQFFYDGLFMNDPYFVNLAPQMSTEAYTMYSADLFPQIREWQANVIAGRMTVDEFFTNYEKLKPLGLQEIIDENAAASDRIQGK